MTVSLQKIIDFSDTLSIPTFILKPRANGELEFVKLNKSHEEKTGLVDEEIRGKSAHEAFSPRLADTLHRNYQQCLTSKTNHSYDEVLNFPAGELWWETALSPIFDDDNNVIAIIGLAIDITSRKTSEFAFADSYREVRRINKDLESLISTTAHDLRGPLRQLILINSMIDEAFETKNEEQTEFLQMSKDILHKALNRIDEIIGNARNLESKADFSAPIDLAHLFSDLFALYDPNKTKECTYPEHKIRAEKYIIDMTCRNLINNAMKFAQKKISITLQSHKDQLIFRISDDGLVNKDDNIPLSNGQKSKWNSPENNETSIAAITQLVTSHGGSVQIDNPDFENGTTIVFSIKGSIL